MSNDKKVNLVVGVDASQAQDGFQKVEDAATAMGKTVSAAGKQAAAPFDKIGDSGDAAAAKLERATKSIVSQIQRTSVAIEAGGKKDSKYFELLANYRGIPADALRPYIEQLKQVEASQNKVGMSAAATANAMRNVPAQFTDIITSLQGGQKPLTVLLQQGGQLKDMFGGAGNAAKAMSTYVLGLISPLNLAAAGVAALAAAYYYGSEQSKRMEIALISTGNYAGTTAAQLDLVAQKVGAATGKYGEARDAVAALAESGKFSASAISAISGAVVASSNLTGKSIAETVAQFEKLKAEPTKAISELNEKYNFLTADIYKQIKALEDRGEVEKAAALASNVYADAVKSRNAEVIENLSYIEKAWKGISKESAAALDNFMGFGRVKTDTEKLAVAKNQLASLRQMGNVAPDSLGAKEIADQEKLVKSLEETIAAKNREAAATGKQAQAEKELKDRRAELEKYVGADKHLTKAKALEQEQKAFQKATQGFAETSKEYQEALAANAQAKKKIEDQFQDKKKADVSKEENAYKSFMVTLREKIALSEAELIADKALTEGRKQRVKFDADIKSGKLAATSAEREYTRALIGQLEVNDSLANFEKEQVQRTKQFVDGFRAKYEETIKLTKVIDDYVETLTSANEMVAFESTLLGKSEAERKIAIEQFKVELALRKEIKKINETDLGAFNSDKAGLIKKATDAAQTRKESIVVSINTEEITKARKELDAFLDPTKAQTFGEALVGSLREAGSALEKMSVSLQEYGRSEAEITKARANAEKLKASDPIKYAKDIASINEKSSRAQIQNYASMAGAAKGFFAEGTKGYKALEAAENTFRMVQLASDLQKGISAAAVGIASQAQGDPYTAIPRMALMAAAMASLGFVTGFFGSSGSGGQTAAERQKEQGTGSVYGDLSAKSDSIAKSIEDMSKNSDRLLPVNQGMLAALKNIESSMAGFTNLVVRDRGVIDGSSFGVREGKVASNFGSGVFSFANSLTGGIFASAIDPLGKLIQKLWGGTKTNIVDSGVQFGGRLVDLQAGKGFNQYASVDTTTSSWFGLKKSTTNTVQSQSLSDELSNQLGLIFTGMGNALKEANKSLGGASEQVTKTLESLTLSSEKISLKGLSGTALTEALNSVISKSLDEMAQAVFPQFEKFREVGEGYAQTVLRVANTFATVNGSFEQIGLKLFSVGDAGVAAALGFSKLLGGLENFQAITARYYENFFSEEERNAKLIKQLTDEFAVNSLGALPASREEYRKLVEQISAIGTAEQLASVLKLSDAFAQVVPVTAAVKKSVDEVDDRFTRFTAATDAAASPVARLVSEVDQLKSGAETAAAILSEKKSLQDQLDQATMTSAQLLEKQRNAVNEVNRALFDDVQAAQAAKQAADTLAQAKAATQAEIDALVNAGLSVEAQREKELAGMDKVLAAMKRRVFALKDEAEATSKLKSQREEQEASMSNLMGAALDGLAATSKAFKNLADTMKQARDSLLTGDQSGLSVNDRLFALKQQLSTASEADTPALANSYLSLLKESGVSGLDYQREFASLVNRFDTASSDALRKSVEASDVSVLKPFYEAIRKQQEEAAATATYNDLSQAYARDSLLQSNATAAERQAFIQRGVALVESAPRSSDAETNSKLIDVMTQVKESMVQVKESTGKTAELLDQISAGGGALLVELA